jgi:hypothetical protein
MSETWTIRVFRLHVQLFPFISMDNQEYTVHFKVKILSKYDCKFKWRSYTHVWIFNTYRMANASAVNCIDKMCILNSSCKRKFATIGRCNIRQDDFKICLGGGHVLL